MKSHKTFVISLTKSSLNEIAMQKKLILLTSTNKSSRQVKVLRMKMIYCVGSSKKFGINSTKQIERGSK